MGSTGDPEPVSPAWRAAGRWRPRADEEGSARAPPAAQPDRHLPARSDLCHA